MTRNRFYECCGRNVQLRHALDCEMSEYREPTPVRTWNVTLLSHGGVQIDAKNTFFHGTPTGAVETLAFHLREEWRRYTESLRDDEAGAAGARTRTATLPQPQSDDQVDRRGFRQPDGLKPRPAQKPRPKPFSPTPWAPEEY